MRRAFASLPAAALYALPALADEPKAGLPQLDPAYVPAQLFWLAISFGLLYLLMAFVALPRVRKTQDSRKQGIASELAAAAAANEQAKAMVVQYEKALTEARARAEAQVSAIKTRVAEESAAQQAVQHSHLTRRLHAAESKIAAARNAALGNIQGVAADLAGAIVEKIAGLKMPVRR